MVITNCPECKNEISVNNPTIGYRIICQNCKNALKVIWLLPIELDFWDEMIELNNNEIKSTQIME